MERYVISSLFKWFLYIEIFYFLTFRFRFWNEILFFGWWTRENGPISNKNEGRRFYLRTLSTFLIRLLEYTMKKKEFRFFILIKSATSIQNAIIAIVILRTNHTIYRITRLKARTFNRSKFVLYNMK